MVTTYQNSAIPLTLPAGAVSIGGFYSQQAPAAANAPGDRSISRSPKDDISSGLERTRPTKSVTGQGHHEEWTLQGL